MVKKVIEADQEFAKKVEALGKLPAIGSILETYSDDIIKGECETEKGLACRCSISSNLDEEPRWVIYGAKGMRGLVIILKKLPEQGFFRKVKITGWAKNEKAVFGEVI